MLEFDTRGDKDQDVANRLLVNRQSKIWTALRAGFSGGGTKIFLG